MSTSSAPRPSKNERREAAREQAKALQKKQNRRSKRAKYLVQGGIAVAVIAVVTVVTLIVLNAIKPEGPGPRNMASNGIVVGAQGVAVQTAATPAGGEPTATVIDPDSDLLDVQIYLDYDCIHCAEFENANADYLTQILDDQIATIEFHPIGFLSDYSLRAASAAACVADNSPDDFYAFSSALLQHRYDAAAAQTATELTADQLKEFAADYVASANLDAVQSCITDKQFRSWAENATNLALSQEVPGTNGETVTGTPAIFVNGQKYAGAASDSASFKTFVAAAAAVEEPVTTETPAPSESAATSSTPTPSS